MTNNWPFPTRDADGNIVVVKEKPRIPFDLSKCEEAPF